MKRRDLIRHLEAHGCEFLREGSKHTIYVNRVAQKTASVPRHPEIYEFLARKICRDLQVPEPRYPGSRLQHLSRMSAGRFGYLGSRQHPSQLLDAAATVELLRDDASAASDHLLLNE